MAKKSDLQVLLEINEADTKNGTRGLVMGVDVVEIRKKKAGTVVSIGVGGDYVSAVFNGEVIPVLFLVDAMEFSKMKNS